MGGSFILMSSGWRLVTRKTKSWLETWNFPSYPSSSRKERGTGDWVNDQSYACTIVSIKIPEVWGSEGFRVGEHTHVLGGRCTPTPLRQKLLLLVPFQTSPYVYLHRAVHLYPRSYPVLYNKLVNVSKCFPDFWELFKQIIESKEGVHGNLWFVAQEEYIFPTRAALINTADLGGLNNRNLFPHGSGG